jgi:hypothetical protein
VIAPALWFSCDHGARLSEDTDFAACATYTSASGREYWDWHDSQHSTPAKLAEIFLEKFPGLAEAGYGQDWLYGGWFQHMLHQTYPESLPVVWDEYNRPEGYIMLISERGDEERRLALPPPGFALSRGSQDRRQSR